jgi:hypothetical protein
MLIGDADRLCAPWIYDHQPPSPLADPAQGRTYVWATLEEGHPLGDQGIGAQEQCERSPVRVGLQNQVLVPKYALGHGSAIGVFQRENVE